MRIALQHKAREKGGGVLAFDYQKFKISIDKDEIQVWPFKAIFVRICVLVCLGALRNV